MALDYDEARRQALAFVDAFNRRDLDAVMAGFHDKMAHQSSYVDRHQGRELSQVDGAQAYREFLRWLWEQQPPIRHVFDEVFTGPHGYAFLTHFEHDATPVVFVRQVDADGLILSQRAYLARPPAG